MIMASVQKAYGQFSSSKTQRPKILDPVEIEFDAQEDLAGGEHSIDFGKGNILIKQTGMYLLIAAPQIGKENGTQSRWIDFWVRVNNVDLPNSNIRRVLTDAHEKDVIVLQVATRLNKGDTVNIMMAVEAEGEGIGIEHIEPPGEPLIPSCILTIVQL